MGLGILFTSSVFIKNKVGVIWVYPCDLSQTHMNLVVFWRYLKVVPMVFGPQSLVVSHQVLLQDIVDLAGFGDPNMDVLGLLGTIDAEIHTVLSGVKTAGVVEKC